MNGTEAVLSNEEMVGVLALAAMAGLGVVLIFTLAWYIIQAIANWKIFTKAGEAGWKSLIPVYNAYVSYKICWKTSMFWIWLGLTLAGCVFSGFAAQDSMVLSMLESICMSAAGVVSVFHLSKMAKAFGKGIGFTLGLLFLNPIFILILGFGSAQYQGADL